MSLPSILAPSSWTKKARDEATGGFWLRIEDEQINLFGKLWKEPADTQPVATLTFIHGLGEHILRYEHVFAEFSQKHRIRVFAWDQRGFGRTVFPRMSEQPGVVGAGGAGGAGAAVMGLGDNQGWNVCMADIYRACRKESEVDLRVDGVPHFLMGHSMGGLLALCFAIKYGSALNLAGLIMSAPAIQPGFPVPAAKRFVANIAATILGSFNIPTELDVNGISRDPQVLAAYKADPLVHDKGSLRTLKALLDRGDKILLKDYKKYDPALPLLMFFGSADRLTSQKAGKEFMDKVEAQDKTYREWDGFFHELHNEPEKDQVIAAYVQWILERASTKQQQAK